MGQKVDGKLLKTTCFWSWVLINLNYAENGNLIQFKQEGGPIYTVISTDFIIVKQWFVANLNLETPKISKTKNNLVQKVWEQLRMLRKRPNLRKS